MASPPEAAVPAAPLAAPRARERRAVWLVSAAHLTSHFYPLLLPPLFPLMREVYGVGYAELGLALTVASLCTALAQAPVGFLVDRLGARGLLAGAVLVQALVFALVGVLPGYAALLVLMALAGFANAVFHPADYAILDASVETGRIGRAFSLHTAAGFAGNALAPVTVLGLAAFVGWQDALLLCALPGVLVAALLWLRKRDLRQSAAARGEASSAPAGGGLALLMSAPVLGGLLFFAALALAGRGVHGFSVAALSADAAVSVAQAGLVLSAFLFASPAGVLAGGWLADRTRRHGRLVAACLAGVAAIMFAVAATSLSLPALLVLFAVAGFLSGVVAPSRDMLIRQVTPPGQTGKVFGFVATGFSLGGMLGPPLFGHVLDEAAPAAVFWMVGGFSLLTALAVAGSGLRARVRRRTRA